MPIRVAINGFGRIGRNVLRAILEENKTHHIQVVAVNDLTDPAASAHLLKYDSIHGQCPSQIEYKDSFLKVADFDILMLQEPDICELPWSDLDIDIVLECTGRNTDKAHASQHIASGAKHVIVSAPVKGADRTVVYGVNHTTLTKTDQLISNASCTTNCLAPLVKVLHENFGVESGVMNTIHAYTNDQHLTDGFSGDLYRARAASLSMIPTQTGAAKAIGLVIPELDGKLSGLAVRVPTSNVSLVDLTVCVTKETSLEEVNQAFFSAANHEFKKILGYNAVPLVSVDFNHHPASSIFDANHTVVMGKQVKVLAWYDNEWGFSNRLLDVIEYIYDQFYLE